MTWWRFGAGVVGTLVLAGLLIWPFTSGRWRGPEPETAAPPVDAPMDATGETATTAVREPTVVVAATGGLVERGLAPLEGGFFESSGLVVDVRRVGTELAVWKLAVEENLIGADVIEVGFRTDAVSGVASSSFLPLDPDLIPGLSTIPEAYRLPEDRGVVVGFTGLLGLAVDTGAVPDPPRSWSDLDVLADDGMLGIPAPNSVLAPVLALAMGAGNAEHGASQYAALVEGGAVLLRTVEDYVQAFRDGMGVAVWTSSGLWRSEGRVQNVRFLAPMEGAVPLPAFSGVLVGTPEAEAAMRWIDFRLSEEVQSAMASIAEQGRFGSDDTPAVSPVIAGIEGLTGDATSYFTLDGFPGVIATVEWASYDDARRAIDAVVGETEQ